ncbi:MAG: pullulanase-type alpha-1,6-glucosidase [Succinivibrionaceae bacterium]
MDIPYSNAESQNGKVSLQYIDEDFGSKKTSLDKITFTLHLWGDDSCDMTVDATDWGSGGMKPTRIDEYGPIWDIDIKGSGEKGCANVIIRDSSEQAKKANTDRIIGDSKFYWTSDITSVSITTNTPYKNSTETSDLERLVTYQKKYSEPFGLIKKSASAYFLTGNYIAWDGSKDNEYVRLQYADTDDGIITSNDNGVLTGKFINLKESSWSDVPDTAKYYNNKLLNSYKVYKITPEDFKDKKINIKHLLKNEMLLLSLNSDNIVKSSSRIQTATLLDELYADKALEALGDNPLGVTIEDGNAVFKLWAPTAQKITLHYYNVVDSEPGSKFPKTEGDHSVEMVADEETGIWTATVENAESLKIAYKYQLSVYNPSTNKIEDTWVTDPYSNALLLNGSNNNSLVVDLKNDESIKPADWDSLPVSDKQKNNVDIAGMMITESHIRDLTVGDDKGISSEHQGKYLGLTEGDSTVVKHLKSLAEAGFTHIEFLPLYDIASIDERKVFSNETADVTISGTEFCERLKVKKTDGIDVCGSNETVMSILAQHNKEGDYNLDEKSSKVDTFLKTYVKDNDSFNWGYDPWHYAVPESTYATDLLPGTNIKEIREMIKYIKEEIGLNIVLDVVYNHTDGDGLSNTSVLDRIVPWYYNRLNPSNGSVYNATCCSDTASEHKMFAKLMEDTLVTWTQDYKIDAFRFDLMGYIPKEVMVQTLANVKRRTKNDNLYFFGEGWNPDGSANVGDDEHVQATQLTMGGTGIGTFNDRIRDAVRGNGPFDHGEKLIKLQGFASGRCSDMNGARPGYTCDPDTDYEYGTGNDKDSDWGMHPLAWQDIIRTSMAGNLKDFTFKTYKNEEKKAGDTYYWSPTPNAYGESPIDTINYVSKHDNPVLFDLIMYKAKKDRTMEDKAKMQAIGLSTVFFGQSPAFDHQGSDLLRTKFFQNDSYNTGDFSNGVNYSEKEGNRFIPNMFVNAEKDNEDWKTIHVVSEYNEDVGADTKMKMADTYKWMAKMRSKYTMLHMGDAELINKHVSFPDAGKDQEGGLIVMKITKPEGEEFTNQPSEIVVMINAKPESTTNKFVNGEGFKAEVPTGLYDESSCTVEDGKLIAAPWTPCLFVKN